MKVICRRRHSVRPEDYESIVLEAVVEVDSTVEEDKEWFEYSSTKKMGAALAEELDAILDSDVKRVVDSDAKYTSETHLWSFYNLEEE